MGTSASSEGPGSEVPFDPPWIEEIDTFEPDDGDPSEERPEAKEDPGGQADRKTPILAPPRRFMRARRNINHFVARGDKESLRKAVGNYSRTGMGGAGNVAHRLRLTTATGSSLFNLLQSAREGSDSAVNEWVKSLTRRGAGTQEISDEIIRRIAPSGGTLDETSCRESINSALSELVEENPNVDLLNLDDDSIWNLIESFLTYEAFGRLALDIGQVFESPDISPLVLVQRMTEMSEYLRSEISAQLSAFRQDNSLLPFRNLQRVLKQAIESTFHVYEVSL